MQVDPIGTKDDLNLYAYVANDAVNRSDPSGMDCTGSRITNPNGNCASTGGTNTGSSGAIQGTAASRNLASLEAAAIQIQQRVRKNTITTLEAGAQLADAAATIYGGQNGATDDTTGFMDAIGRIGAGLKTEQLIPERDVSLRVSLGTDSGFATRFQDNSAQVEHFFGSMLASYRGGLLGLIYMQHREQPTATADLALNRVAFLAAHELSIGYISIHDVGNFMRSHLAQ